MSSASESVSTTELPDQEIEKIYQQTWRLVHRTAYRYTYNWHDAEEVLQTIFARLMRGPLPEGILQNPRAYLYRAAVNESFHVYWRRKRQKAIPMPENFEPLEIAKYRDGSPLYERTRERLYDA